MRKEQRYLKNFLRERELLTRFKLNGRNDWTKNEGFDNMFLGIGSAFVWRYTPEGYAFWKKLDEDFKKYREVSIRLEHFEKLLKKHDALKAFKVNMVKRVSKPKESIRWCVETGNDIISAFYWERTPEGHLFWYNIDEEWREICESI